MKIQTNYKYLRAWVDKKTGRPYARLRFPGRKEVSLPFADQIGSPEFYAGYMAAFKGEQPTVAVARVRKSQNCIEVAIKEYIESVLPGRIPKQSSRDRQSSTLRKWSALDGVGASKVSDIDADYINEAILEAPSRGVARTWLITVRPFFQWAKAKKFIELDPTDSIKIKLDKSEGHYTWEEEDIAQFEARWQIGTLERLLFALLIYTGQRCSDVLKLGPTRVINGTFKVRSQKTNVDVEVKLHPELLAAISAYKVVGLRTATYLHNAKGGPLQQRDLNKLFRKACREAGLDDKFVPHGLRKGFCRRLADLGMDPWTIASLSGHLSIKEVMRYCEAFNRRQRGSKGMDALIAAHPAKEVA